MNEINATPVSGVTNSDEPSDRNDRGRASRWLTGWSVLLSDVLLFASALNCLFRWLAYGHVHDGAAFLLSIVLALTVYFLAMNPQRMAKLSSRLIVAFGAVIVWAVFMPVVMRFAGLN